LTSFCPKNGNPYPNAIDNFAGMPGIEFLAKTGIWCKFGGMKTLTVEEATPGLGRLVDLALAGEQIQIRKGSGIVELRPAKAAKPAVNETLTPREALRLLQEDARMTPSQAKGYLRELREERLASEGWRPA
jgi:hypothetical protein